MPQVEQKNPPVYQHLVWLVGLALGILAVGVVLLFRHLFVTRDGRRPDESGHRNRSGLEILRRLSGAAQLHADGAGRAPVARCWAATERGKPRCCGYWRGSRRFRKVRFPCWGRSLGSAEARRTTGFLGHGIGVYEDLSARENLIFSPGRPVAEARRAIGKWLERVDLARVADIPVRQYSRGMRQRLALARTFLRLRACCCWTSRLHRSMTAPSRC